MGRIYKKIKISGLTGKEKEIEAVIDTGSDGNAIIRSLAEEIEVGISPQKGKVQFANKVTEETKLGAIGIEIDGCETATIVNVMDKLSAPLILGNRFLQDLNADIDFKEDEMIIRRCKPVLI